MYKKTKTDKTMTVTLYIAYDEFGNVVGNMRRDEALESLWGSEGRVIEMTLVLPPILDTKTRLTVPDDPRESLLLVVVPEPAA